MRREGCLPNFSGIAMINVNRLTREWFLLVLVDMVVQHVVYPIVPGVVCLQQ